VMNLMRWLMADGSGVIIVDKCLSPVEQLEDASQEDAASGGSSNS
jgi:hypothetical protein